MPEFYKLVGRKPVPVSMTESARSFGAPNNSLAKTLLDGYLVSTVFLGLAHGYRNNKPLLFESMIFKQENGSEKSFNWQLRYATFDNALRGHLVLLQFFYETYYPTGTPQHYVKGMTGFRFRQVQKSYAKQFTRKFRQRRFALILKRKPKEVWIEPFSTIKHLVK